MKELESVTKGIVQVGNEILKIKNEHKGNQSLAKKCESYSYENLKHILLKTGIPIISRFDKIDFEERKNWKTFWILNPLIGKKSLRESKDDYLISITKIENRRPVLAALLAPEKKELLIAKGSHAYKISEIGSNTNLSLKNLLNKKNLIKKPTEGFFFTILKDRYKMNSKTENFLLDFKAYKKGSLKEVIDEGPMNLLGIAEGVYDFYPHLKQINEWEIAGFDAIISASGNMVTKKDGILPLLYNSKNLKFPGFIAKNNFEFDSIDLQN